MEVAVRGGEIPSRPAIFLISNTSSDQALVLMANRGRRYSRFWAGERQSASTKAHCIGGL